MSLIALLVSLVSVAIASVSFWRTKQLQDFDYAARLQLVAESVYGGGPGRNVALTYKATLANRGIKPVRIDSVWVDYGCKDSDAKRLRHHVEGEFYLCSGETREVIFQLEKDSWHKALKDFFIDQCHFYLRVRFYASSRTIAETTRPLVGLGEHSATSYAHKGEILV